MQKGKVCREKQYSLSSWIMQLEYKIQTIGHKNLQLAACLQGMDIIPCILHSTTLCGDVRTFPHSRKAQCPFSLCGMILAVKWHKEFCDADSPTGNWIENEETHFTLSDELSGKVITTHHHQCQPMSARLYSHGRASISCKWSHLYL